MTRLLVSLSLFVLLSFMAGHRAQKFLESVEERMGMEFYEFNEDRYGIYPKMVTWDEAEHLCLEKNATLIDFEAPGVAEFIALALAESAVGFGAVWIGGQLVPVTEDSEEFVWRWTDNDHDIVPLVDEGTKFPMDTPPYWVDLPGTDSESPACLGTDRRLHHLPLIVPVDCGKQRPYICKHNIEPSPGPVPAGPPITIKGRRFHLFHGEVTWRQALSYCHNLAMKLAKISTANEFKLVRHRMLRARPVFENAWIGGVVSKDKVWRWVGTNEPINVDKEKETEDNPFPWYRPEEIIHEGCLLADRHVSSHFVYVEAQCDRRRNFICEQEMFLELQPLTQVSKTVWVSTYKETWPKAHNICKTCLDEGELVQLHPDQENVEIKLPVLYSAMSVNVATEVRHVWVGAHLDDDKQFRWTLSPNSSGLTAAQYDGLSKENGEDGQLVYCEVNLQQEAYLLKYKCLNLDRENQKHFFMYGLACDLKQHFICQAQENSTLKEACSHLDENKEE